MSDRSSASSESEGNAVSYAFYTKAMNEAADTINQHIMEYGDPGGLLASAIETLDHSVEGVCPVCN